MQETRGPGQWRRNQKAGDQVKVQLTTVLVRVLRDREKEGRGVPGRDPMNFSFFITNSWVAPCSLAFVFLLFLIDLSILVSRSSIPHSLAGNNLVVVLVSHDQVLREMLNTRHT